MCSSLQRIPPKYYHFYWREIASNLFGCVDALACLPSCQCVVTTRVECDIKRSYRFLITQVKLKGILYDDEEFLSHTHSLPLSLFSLLEKRKCLFSFQHHQITRPWKLPSSGCGVNIPVIIGCEKY